MGCSSDLQGEWEFIRVFEPRAERRLEAGQILWGEGDLQKGEWNDSFAVSFSRDGTLKLEDATSGRTIPGKGTVKDKWEVDEKDQLLNVTINGEKITDLILHAGHDWERETDTILFTGLDSHGRSVWGKKLR